MDWFETLRPFFENGSYAAVFVALILCGLGFPIPEEVTFILAGYVVDQAESSLGLMILVGMIGLMVGDTCLFYLGRNYGQQILRLWPFKVFFSEPTLEKSKEFFKKHGSKAVFFAGFFAGIRASTFFVSASMGFKYHKFIFWDFLRAILTCPISIWAGYEFGTSAQQWLAQHFVLFMSIITLIVAIWILHKKIRTNMEKK